MNPFANKLAHRIMTVLLLASFAGCLLCAPALALPVARNHTPGCHGHRPMLPGQVPTDHQCCVSGHQTAVPTAASSPGGIEIGGNLQAVEIQVVATVENPLTVAFLPKRPPAPVPLRV
jgi:hypothetical protein